MIKLKDLLNELTSSKLWYHGTYNDDIVKFNTIRMKDRMGAYFSDNKNVAGHTHSTNMPYIYTVKIKSNKILDLSKYKESSKTTKEFLGKLPLSDEFIRSYLYNSGEILLPYKVLEYADSRENLVPKLKRKGLQGIIFSENNANTIVVFYSDIIQIVKIEVNK